MQRNAPDSLRAADPDPDQKDQRSANDDLKRRAEKRRIHITVSNPTDKQKLNRHD
jgi:hypothetical protein